jgi:simple sugar transport system substrate-binding protein
VTEREFDTARALEGRLDRRTLLGAGAAGAAVALAWGRQGTAHAAPLAGPTTSWGSGVHIRFFAGGNAGDLFASIVFNGAKQAETDLGPTVDYIFSGWDVSMMTDQLRQAIATQPDGIAMMGHPGDDALLPLAQQARDAGILMEYQNVDLPKVRQAFGGGYIGADLTPRASHWASRPSRRSISKPETRRSSSAPGASRVASSAKRALPPHSSKPA